MNDKNPDGFLTLSGSWAVSLLRPLTLRPQVALSLLLSESYRENLLLNQCFIQEHSELGGFMNVVLFSRALLTFFGGGIKGKSALGKGALVVNTVQYIRNQRSV